MENSIQILEEILFNYKKDLGKDFGKYRNHVHRVFSLCLSIDNTIENQEKYAIAAAYHDLGIWTSKTFDYLEPSIALVTNYLDFKGQAEWIDEIKLMIDMHHKRSKYKGDYQNTVETFRRADWIDVTKGKKLFGLSKVEYSKVIRLYPTLGFHRFLLVQTLKNVFKSPLNPLPMFKK